MKLLTEYPPDAVPLQADTFHWDGTGIRLVASRCERCSSIFFPKRRFCGRCGARTLKDELLAPEGTLRAYSMIDRKSAVSKVEPPYVQACVAMPEGLNVYTVLAGAGADEVTLGQKVSVRLAEIERDAKGRPVVAYVFSPSPEQTEVAQ